MLRRVLMAVLPLLLLSMPAVAQECKVDVDVRNLDGLSLDIEYACKSTQALAFTADGDRMARRVVEVRDGWGRSRGKQVAPSNNAWRIEPVGGMVTMNYRFDLSGYARSADSTSSALQRADGVLVLLSGWLLEPRGYGFNPTIDIKVNLAPGIDFAAGLPRVGHAWRLQDINVRFAGYTVFGDIHQYVLAVPGSATLRLAILAGLPRAPAHADVIAWAKGTAEAQANFWGGFPASHSLLAVVPMQGRTGAGSGRSVSGGGSTVVVELGADQLTPQRLFEERVLVHEWVHTAMPHIRGRATWFMEGAATYLEPIIRARAGWKTEAEVWDEWIANMPKGAQAFMVGLSNTQGQGHHWGGAIFMLLADIELRKSTGGMSGLEDCFKGALKSGLDASKRVDLDEYVAACDRATGTKVVADLSTRYSAKGQPVDLAKLWSDLGVAKGGAMNDAAPLAKWRKMIVYGDRPMKKVKRPGED